MRQIAVINQKGGVGKTTTAINLAAALVSLGRRVVVVDMDPQANLSLHVDRVADSGAPSAYQVLTGTCTFAEAIVETDTPNLRIVPSNIDLSGAETELASAMGRETILGEAINRWVADSQSDQKGAPTDYLIFDCPPSLGLLALNALATAGEVLLTVQTEFLALQGMSKLVEIVQLVRQRLNDKLKITGILPCMYDTRLRLAREVLSEIRKYFPGQVFKQPIGTNVKLAEAPSFGQTIIQYAPDSKGAADYRAAAHEVIAQEVRHPEMAHLPRPAQPAAPVAPKAQPKPAAKSPAKPPTKPAIKASEPSPTKVRTAPTETPTPVNTPAPAPAKSETQKPAELEAAKPTADAKPAPEPKPPAPASSTPPAAKPAVKPAVQTPAPEKAPAPEPELREEVITPTAPPARKPVTPVAPEAPTKPPVARNAPGIIRAENLPPLPRDAFDNYLDNLQGF